MTDIGFSPDPVFARSEKRAAGLKKLERNTRRDISLEVDSGSTSSADYTPHVSSSQYSDEADVQHLAELAEFVTAVADGVSRVAFPRPQQPYSAVHVLMISWKDDDLRTEHEISKLKALFEDIYRYPTNHYKIPSNDSPEFDLEFVLSQTNMQHGRDEDGMLIIYYGGHGELEKKSSDSIWKAWKSPPTGSSINLPRSPQLNWSDVQRTAMKAKGDILFILDCCYASGAIRAAHNAPRGHTTRREMLLASGNEKASNQNSLTKAIICELDQLRGSPCTISSLHSKLMENQLEHGLRPTPIFTCITGAPAGVTLVPLPDPTNSETLDKRSMMTPHAGLAQLASPCKVLITVALTDIGGYSMQMAWMEWFRDHAPPNIAEVSISQIINPEAVYISNSYRMFFSIPVSVWNAMPTHPAIKLVSVIRSKNMIPIGDLELVKGHSATELRLKRLLGNFTYPDSYWTLWQENRILRERASILEHRLPSKASIPATDRRVEDFVAMYVHNLAAFNSRTIVDRKSSSERKKSPINTCSDGIDEMGAHLNFDFDFEAMYDHAPCEQGVESESAITALPTTFQPRKHEKSDMIFCN
jgi:hypothetical protein